MNLFILSSIFLYFSFLPGSLAVRNFNLTTCPGWWELQTEKVKESFEIEKFEGTYYELALHDWTQDPACASILGGPQCVQSIKYLDNVTKDLLVDDWTLQCFGTPYPVPLYFNLTDIPGYFLGFSPADAFKNRDWPDTIVDYKLSEDGKHYEWVIEFQCNEFELVPAIRFVGINFYARHYNVTDDYYNEFIKAGYDAGLGVYLDNTWGLYRVPMDNCPWFEDKQDIYPPQK